MDGRLPLTLRGREGEPCHAAATRLGSRWGVGDGLRLARDLGHPMPDMVRGIGVRPFAEKAGLDADVVDSHSPVIEAASRTVRLRAQVLRLGDWSVRSRRRCPLCVDEDKAEARRMGIEPDWWATSLAWWDIRSVDVCHRHGVRMTDECAACGARQTWRRGLLRCGCGAEHGPNAVEEGDPAVASYILSRLSYLPVGAVPALDGMELVDAIRTMELLGAARLEWRPVKPRRPDDDLPGDRLHGFRLAADWPTGFHALLDGLVAARSADAADGLLSAYGWLYSDICVGDAPRATAELVAPVLREHAVANGIIARDEERLGAEVPPTMSATAAARRIGRSYAVTRRMLEAADGIPEGSRRGVPFALDSVVVDGLLGAVVPTAAQQRAALGVGRGQARRLVNDPIVLGSLPVGATAVADALLHEVLARAEPRSGHDLVPLPLACRNMSVPLNVACRKVLEGRLRVSRCGTAADGLSAVTIVQSDLAALRATRDSLCVQEVARLHGIHHEAARSLARLGAFGARDPKGRVSSSTVSDFFRAHVTAADYARARRTSPKRVRETLALLGIHPVFGPPSCRQMIYRRDDLPVIH